MYKKLLFTFQSVVTADEEVDIEISLCQLPTFLFTPSPLEHPAHTAGRTPSALYSCSLGNKCGGVLRHQVPHRDLCWEKVVLSCLAWSDRREKIRRLACGAVEFRKQGGQRSKQDALLVR